MSKDINSGNFKAFEMQGKTCFVIIKLKLLEKIKKIYAVQA